MKRNNVLDVAKGLGIILVVWAHTVCPIKPYVMIFHMPIFFLLSGYVFNENDSIKTTFSKKLRSLMVPFVFFLILQRIGFIIIHVIDGSFTFNNLLIWKQVYPGITIGTLWFFLALFTTTMIYSIIGKMPKEIFKFTISFLLTFAGYLLYVYNIHLPLHIDSSLSMVFFFYVGKKISLIKFKRVISFLDWLLMTIASIVLYIIYIHWYFPSIDVSLNVFGGSFLPTLGVMFLGCFMLLLISKMVDYIPQIRSVLGYLGRNTLTIFALNFVIMYSIYLLFPKESISTIGGIIVMLYIIGLSLLFNLLLQKYFPFIFGKTKKRSTLLKGKQFS